MTKKEKEVEKILEEMSKELAKSGRSGRTTFSEAEKYISSTDAGKEAIKKLRALGIDSGWLRQHGFIIAYMLLDLGGKDEVV